MVWSPFRPDSNKLDDCCMPAHPGQGQFGNIEGFVCELYTAPGQITIGLGRTWEEANDFCATAYGGSLLSLHTEDDYNRLVEVVGGYTEPIMIGWVVNSTTETPVHISLVHTPSRR